MDEGGIPMKKTRELKKKGLNYLILLKIGAKMRLVESLMEGSIQTT
jgi:hypothetical protein